MVDIMVTASSRNGAVILNIMMGGDEKNLLSVFRPCTIGGLSSKVWDRPDACTRGVKYPLLSLRFATSPFMIFYHSLIGSRWCLSGQEQWMEAASINGIDGSQVYPYGNQESFIKSTVVVSVVGRWGLVAICVYERLNYADKGYRTSLKDEWG